MGKRYYCDFCDKRFPYNIQNLQKHNSGSQHLQLKHSYYAQYKDIGTILAEEREKKPCNRFLSARYCLFGDLCKCSHKTRAELEHLEDLYRLECHNKSCEEERKIKKDQITKKRWEKIDISSNQISDYLSREEEEFLQKILPSFDLPKQLRNYNQNLLPKSLIPPNYEDLINHEASTWG